MEIKPNDINRSTESLPALDPQIAKLLSSFANRPLLLEKLFLNQSQGLIITLSNQTKPNGQSSHKTSFSLQIPLALSKLFENASQLRTEIYVVITPNQRIILSIAQPISTLSTQVSTALLPGLSTLISTSTKSLEQPATNQTSKQPTNQPPEYLTNNKASKQEVVQFRSAQLLPERIIRLLDPAPATAHQLKLLNFTNPSIISKKFTVDNIAQESGNLIDNKTSATTIATTAARLLSNYFSKQNPVATHLTHIKQTFIQLKNIKHPLPAVTKLNQQIERLINDLKISSLPTGDSIKQRILSSGNLLESLAAKNIQSSLASDSARSESLNSQSTTTQQRNRLTKNENASTIPESLRHFVKSESPESKVKLENKTSNNVTKSPTPETSKTPVDLKLQLMQIRATLESLLKINIKISRQEPVPTGERISPNVPENLQQTNPSIKPHAVLQTNQNTPAPKAPLSMAQQNLIFKLANELLTEVRHIISQIENNQLQSLRSEPPNLQQFLVDLPFANDKDIDSFELLFESQIDKEKAGKIKNWKVVVRFDLEPLGAMFAQIELRNERISTHIFAESQQTASLINEHMHVLKKSLFSAGVDVDELKSSQGKIPEKLIKDDPNKVDIRV